MSSENKFYACVPQYWLFLSKFQRKFLGWITLELFTLSFFGLPACIIFFIPWFWKSWPVMTTTFLVAVVTSMLLPRTEWEPFRKLFQLWYEIFDVSCNLSPEEVTRLLNENTQGQTIQAMHPHGVVPFQGALWASYCDQHLHDPASGRSLYGFSGMASMVQYAPFLRNIVGWLSGVPADYAVLKRGLMKGETPHCSLSAGRKPRHLFLMPGGVAEIFVSKPGAHAIVFKSRKGLCRLSIETGAKLLPTYVFGGNEFFHNLTNYDGIFSHLSRVVRAGVTFFWGRWGLPIPFTPRVTMVVGEPIPPPTEGWDGVGPVPGELIDQLHQTYMKRMIELFDRYKGDCGCPDAILEIL